MFGAVHSAVLAEEQRASASQGWQALTGSMLPPSFQYDSPLLFSGPQEGLPWRAAGHVAWSEAAVIKK